MLFMFSGKSCTRHPRAPLCSTFLLPHLIQGIEEGRARVGTCYAKEDDSRWPGNPIKCLLRVQHDVDGMNDETALKGAGGIALNLSLKLIHPKHLPRRGRDMEHLAKLCLTEP